MQGKEIILGLTMKQYIEIGFLLVLLTTSVSATEQITMTYSFQSPKIEKVSVAGDIFDRITIARTEGFGQPGQPVLPAVGSRLLLPFGTEVTNIEVIAEGKVSIGKNHRIEPGLCPTKSSSDFSYPALVDLNVSIYNSDQLFPSDPYKNLGVQLFRGFPILIVRLHPVQYIPSTGELFYSPIVHLRVHLQQNAKSIELFRGLPVDFREIESRIDNPEVISSYAGTATSGKSYDLMILTVPGLEEAFLPLMDYHNSMGMTTEIHSTADVGSNDPNAIREYVRDRYLSDGIEYLLIGADDDEIPSKDLFAPFMWLDYGTMTYMYDTIADMPGDLYFGCLDGPYNFDSDTLWGEPTDGEGGGEVDLVAEVYVGRAPVDNVADVDRFVSKTLRFLQTNRSDFARKVLLAGEWLGKGGVSEYSKPAMQEYKDSSDANGFITYGFSTDLYAVDELYDRDSPVLNWPVEELCSFINRSPQIVMHYGHANTDYAMKMFKAEVTSDFQNNEPFFLYSLGCYAGNFDGHECWAEYATVKSEQAAVAAVMNARFGSSAYYESTDGSSHRFGREFFDAVYSPLENKPELGRANQDSKEDNLYRLDERSMRWCYLQTNLFGDPTVALKREWLNYRNVQFTEVTGDGDDIPEGGETIEAIVTFANFQAVDVNDVTVVFYINDASIAVHNNSASLGTIVADDSASNESDPFIFEIPIGYTPRNDTFYYNLTWNGGSKCDTVDIPQKIGETSILLVDDDGGDNYDDYYQECLNKMSIPYDIFTNTPTEHPDSAFLADYDIVFWLTGNRLFNTDPYSSDLIEFEEAPVLQQYLNGGGKLFLSGQHMAFQLSVFNFGFLNNYLRAQYLSSGFINALETESGGDVFEAGDLFQISGSDGAGNQIGPDQIAPYNGGIAELHYVGTSEIGAVSYSGDYHMVFMPFGFEAIPNTVSSGIPRDTVLVRILDYFGYQRPSGYPQVSSLSLVGEDLTHVIGHNPEIGWDYADGGSGGQEMYHIQVGCDNNWAVVETWDYGPVSGSSESEIYAGLELVDGQDYCLRIRVYDGSFWSGWQTLSYHMNTAPPIPDSLLPYNGQAIPEDSIILSLENVADSEGDLVTYAYEIYGDAEMTFLVENADDIPADPGIRTEQSVVTALTVDQEYFWRARADDGFEPSGWSPLTSFLVEALYICGDANKDKSINVGDAVYLVNLIFHNGPVPDPEAAGDVNCDGGINIGDAVYLVNYIFKQEAPGPCAACP